MTNSEASVSNRRSCYSFLWRHYAYIILVICLVLIIIVFSIQFDSSNEIYSNQIIVEDSSGEDLPDIIETANEPTTASIGPSKALAIRGIDVSDLKHALPNTRIMKRNLKTTTTPGRCKQPSGRRILINYASNCCWRSQPKNCRTGLTVGGFDVCIMFDETSLDEEFKQLNEKIFSEKTGGGFWLWKPYIILKTLVAMRDDDVLFYSDSGTHFIGNMDAAHICLQNKLGMDITLFSDNHPEHELTKPDAYILMGVDAGDPKYADGMQLIAAFSLFRKTFRSIRFVGQWLGYAQDYRIISNSPSHFATNPPDFSGHRNDQSIVSLLSKKWNLEIWPDPSQWGEIDNNKEKRQLERYRNINRTFIKHTRDKY